MQQQPLNRPDWVPPPDVSREAQREAAEAVVAAGPVALTVAQRISRVRLRRRLRRFERYSPMVAGPVALMAVGTGLEAAVCCALLEMGSLRRGYLFAALLRLQATPSLWLAAYHCGQLGTPGVEFADQFSAKLAIWRVRLR